MGAAGFPGARTVAVSVGPDVDTPGGDGARRRSTIDSAPTPDPLEEQGQDMPKNKSHSGTKKRIKVTGTGKLLREKAGKRHLLEKKSSHKTRQLSGNEEVAPQDAGRVKRLLGGL